MQNHRHQHHHHNWNSVVHICFIFKHTCIPCWALVAVIVIALSFIVLVALAAVLLSMCAYGSGCHALVSNRIPTTKAFRNNRQRTSLFTLYCILWFCLNVGLYSLFHLFFSLPLLIPFVFICKMCCWNFPIEFDISWWRRETIDFKMM